MEAFRKYRSKTVKDLGLILSDPYDEGYLIGIRHGWRAALECMKSRSQQGKELYMIAEEDIDKELEDK